jgi:hypothetical protein
MHKKTIFAEFCRFFYELNDKFAKNVVFSIAKNAEMPL